MPTLRIQNNWALTQAYPGFQRNPGFQGNPDFRNIQDIKKFQDIIQLDRMQEF